MERRLFGELIWLVVRRNKRPHNIVFAEPGGRDFHLLLLLDLDMRQLGELLRYSSGRRAREREDPVALEVRVGLANIGQGFHQRSSRVTGGAHDKESRTSHCASSSNVDVGGVVGDS
jgi:hypothetical protein